MDTITIFFMLVFIWISQYCIAKEIAKMKEEIEKLKGDKQ